MIKAGWNSMNQIDYNIPLAEGSSLKGQAGYDAAYRLLV